MRTYSELVSIPSYLGRFRYLKLDGLVGQETFGFERYLNQSFYRSKEWRQIRNQIILRDNGCDLAWDGYEIHDRIYIHHLNPIRTNDIIKVTDLLLDPEYLVCVSFSTHNAIHYGDEQLLISEPIVRTQGDTCPWKTTQ